MAGNDSKQFTLRNGQEDPRNLLTSFNLIPELDNFQRHICAVRARDETNASFSHVAILYYRDTYVLST